MLCYDFVHCKKKLADVLLLRDVLDALLELLLVVLELLFAALEIFDFTLRGEHEKGHGNGAD